METETTNKRFNVLCRRLASAMVCVLAFFAISATAPCEETINVITTIPDLANFARAVGGDRVTVKSIARGTEDMHLIPMKPSYLLMLNKADMLLEMGLDMEHAWLPDLLYNCRNKKIQPGEPGFVNCSARIRVKEKQDHPNRSEGDAHPEGNPHFNLDPANGLLVAATVCDGMCRAYPQHAGEFRANLKAYSDRLKRKTARWKEMVKPLKGIKVITYHRSWSYFVEFTGMEVIGEIEPKPGIAPTAGHLARLIRKIQEQKADLIIKEPYFSNRYPELLKKKTGIPYVSLPNMSGGSEETATYIRFIEHNVRRVLETLGHRLPAESEDE